MQDYLAIILGPVAVGLFLFLVLAWREVRSVHHNNDLLLAKVAELEKVIADSKREHDRQMAELRSEKDAEIQRQKDKVVELHKELEDVPRHPGKPGRGF
jgi:DNA polymerase III alpha subunit